MSAPQPGTPLPWRLLPVKGDEIRIGYNTTGNWLATVWNDEFDDDLAADAELDAAYIVHAANNFPKAQALADAAGPALHELDAYIRCTFSGEASAELTNIADDLRAALAAWDAKP